MESKYQIAVFIVVLCTYWYLLRSEAVVLLSVAEQFPSYYSQRIVSFFYVC